MKLEVDIRFTMNTEQLKNTPRDILCNIEAFKRLLRHHTPSLIKPGQSHLPGFLIYLTYCLQVLLFIYLFVIIVSVSLNICCVFCWSTGSSTQQTASAAVGYCCGGAVDWWRCYRPVACGIWQAPAQKCFVNFVE